MITTMPPGYSITQDGDRWHVEAELPEGLRLSIRSLRSLQEAEEAIKRHVLRYQGVRPRDPAGGYFVHGSGHLWQIFLPDGAFVFVGDQCVWPSRSEAVTATHIHAGRVAS